MQTHKSSSVVTACSRQVNSSYYQLYQLMAILPTCCYLFMYGIREACVDLYVLRNLSYHMALVWCCLSSLRACIFYLADDTAQYMLQNCHTGNRAYDSYDSQGTLMEPPHVIMWLLCCCLYFVVALFSF